MQLEGACRLACETTRLVSRVKMSKKKVEGTGERKLEVYPPIYKAGPVGKWLRDQLMKGKLMTSLLHDKYSSHDVL